jgi:signal transduction histidine kinase
MNTSENSAACPEAAEAQITGEKPAEEQQIRLEAELLQASRLSSIGLLATGIVHDFNNLLSVIGVHVELAIMDTHEAAVAQSLAQVQRATARAKDLAAQILTYANQKHEERQPVRLSSVVEEVLQLLRPSLPRQIEVSAQLSPDAGWILANPTQIHQVLFNLCTNAVHAMGRGPGRLEITLNPSPDGWLRLVVRDTGQGMDAATRARIFDPFFTTKAARGTGLGLAIVSRIVQSHGGTLEVQSEPGCGASFEIRFSALAGQTAGPDGAR